MDEQLRMQDRVAQALSVARHEIGALDFETIEVQHVFEGDTLRDLQPQAGNRAKALIENLMIAANGVTARFLDRRGFPSLRRVVKSPERWDRIRALAAETGETLPAAADSTALAELLARRRQADPETFPDLSRTVIQLLGSGEYVVDPPGAEPPGHFGLAVRDYTHSTAPNRRYPDLVTQRLLKAALADHPSPYAARRARAAGGALHAAGGRGEQGRAAGAEVGRGARRRIARRRAVRRHRHRRLEQGHVVPRRSPPIEGRRRGDHALDVGDRVRVAHRVNVDRGFIDFARHDISAKAVLALRCGAALSGPRVLASDVARSFQGRCSL